MKCCPEPCLSQLLLFSLFLLTSRPLEKVVCYLSLFDIWPGQVVYQLAFVHIPLPSLFSPQRYSLPNSGSPHHSFPSIVETEIPSPRTPPTSLAPHVFSRFHFPCFLLCLQLLFLLYKTSLSWSGFQLFWVAPPPPNPIHPSMCS